MVTTRFQTTLEAKREANRKCSLHALPPELLLIICEFLGLPFRHGIIHLFLRRQPVVCETSHPDRCSRGRHFPDRVRRYIGRARTTVWHLMQASWCLRNFVRPLYIARTVHLICVQQLSAYQQSTFCNDELKPFGRRTGIYVDYVSTPLVPLMVFEFYHKQIDIDIHYYGQHVPERLRRFCDKLRRLIELRHEVWMTSLLQRAKDLTLDIRGDIRLIPDPRYFAAHPDLRGLMKDLAQLRLHSCTGLYVLLMPMRKVEKENTTVHRTAIETLAHPYWRKHHPYWRRGFDQRRIQEVLYRKDVDWERYFDVIPTKEFIASGRDLRKVGIGIEWLNRYAQEPVWLRMFPAVGEDVEEDGFGWRDCGGVEDRDWQPTNIDQETSSEEQESEDSNADDVVDWKREKLKRRRGKAAANRDFWKAEEDAAAWKGEVEEDAAWRRLENMVVDDGEYEENESDLVTSGAVLEAESKIWLPTLLRKRYGGIGLEVPTA